MIWITKYRHNKIVEEYRADIKDLTKALNQKENLEKILDKLTDKTNGLAGMSSAWVTTGEGVMASLDDSVPRYVEDYFGGKVIKQEATPVTILDNRGKAAYGLTRRSADKGKTYLLVEECKKF